MVKHTQTIRQQHPTNCLSVFDHAVKLALKGLKIELGYYRYGITHMAKSLCLIEGLIKSPPFQISKNGRISDIARQIW